jgi:DNA repair exonuclease SbcCD ATPase subunit
MEFEQIIKRLDWLETEQRKTKADIAAVENKLTAVETSVDAVSKQIKGLSKEIADVASSAARLNQFTEMLSKQRDDFSRSLEEMEKKNQQRERDSVKRHVEGLEPLQVELEKFRRSITTDVTAVKAELKVRFTDQIRLADSIAEVKPRIDEVAKVYEEVKGAQRILDENRRQDIKRVADVQGELTALRKRIDEVRGRTDLSNDSLRNMENRIAELLSSENERKITQIAFIEQQSLAQIERDRALKAWSEKLEEFKTTSHTLDTQLASIDESLRLAKKVQETYTDLNVKLERRITEVSEMQRLAEDRVRQEWVTFKADDQKRWTGYTLSQEESLRDLKKEMERIENRATALDDVMQVIQDQMQQTADATEKQLQEVVNVFHEWLTSYERIMGHSKKAPVRKGARS